MNIKAIIFSIFAAMLLISCRESDETVDYREDSFSVEFSIENSSSYAKILEIGTVIKHKNSDKWTLEKNDSVEIKKNESSNYLINRAMIWESFAENDIDGFSFFIKDGENYYTGFYKNETCQLEENKNINSSDIKKDGLVKLLLKEKSNNSQSYMNFYTSFDAEPVLSKDFTETNIQTTHSCNNYQILFNIKIEDEVFSFTPIFEGSNDGTVSFIKHCN